MKKYVYYFSQQKSDGNSTMKELLGGKGANLAQMAKLGMPVPPGFTISTEACTYFYQNNQKYPKELVFQIKAAVERVEKFKKSKFGNIRNPLLFSVRSGARVSMPGMMNTVLNLGLNDEIVEEIAKTNFRFAWNSYWRFIFMFADVVMGAEKSELDEVLNSVKKERKVVHDIELSDDDWKETAKRLKEKVKELTGREIPQNPWDQILESIGAVFKSWNTPRAITYRRLNKIPENWGTAVNIQSMVFGNLDDCSASGVGFTRNPSTGEKKLFGEFLQKAQGEDVVAGIRTPNPISELKKQFPKCFKELLIISKNLENYFKDMQDIEFTIENGRLWMLQTRTGKRTAQAAVKMALDMEKEKLISRKDAILRINPNSIESFFRPSFSVKSKKEVLARGLAASPGAAVGAVVFDPKEAEKFVEEGRRVILVRDETSPDDIHGMAVSEGILTARGGMTSHAALVARGMGKPCIVGCGEIEVDYKKEQFFVAGKIIKKGENISIDGTTGNVIFGEVPTVLPETSGDLEKILKWADEIRKLKVYANADTPAQAEQARKFGAEGIGLCRTEHMFFEESRIEIFQQMILVKNKEERKKSLERIIHLQKSDFVEIFKAMKGLPVIIRFLDPPLHEFLPKKDEDIKRIAQKLGISFEELKSRIENLRELNPMLGHRGCRLGITFPEIYQAQAMAIAEALCEIFQKSKIKLVPKIMIPLIMDIEEFKIIHNLIEEVFVRERKNRKIKIDYKIGTMIELPRAAILAGEIAKEAEFFSFGTNDLTQTTLGISRDDAGRFLSEYLDKKIFKEDPFISIDENGVGEIIKIGKNRGKSTRKNLEVGICGEQGGDPKSIEFCNRIGLDYVSCSPFRVPVARLSAAQAVLKEKK